MVNKYSLNKYSSRCYHVLGPGDAMTSKMDRIVILMERISYCSGPWDRFGKVCKLKIIFIIILKHYSSFPHIYCADIYTNNTDNGQCNFWYPDTNPGGDAELQEKSLYSPPSCTFSYKHVSWAYECPWWSSKNYRFDSISTLEVNLFNHLYDTMRYAPKARLLIME